LLDVIPNIIEDLVKFESLLRRGVLLKLFSEPTREERVVRIKNGHFLLLLF
jgi:hypothetical protein